MASALIFEDIFEVGALDPDGKKFVKGKRRELQREGTKRKDFAIHHHQPPPFRRRPSTSPPSAFSTFSLGALTPESSPSSPRNPPIPFTTTTVSRIEGRSDLYEMDLTLDVAVDVYPLAVGDKLSLALAGTLALDGGPTEPFFGAAAQGGRASLADAYEYVAHGTVFKLRDAAGSGAGAAGGAGAAAPAVGRCEALVSFGGLLMRLAGDGVKLGGLRVGDGVYLLMRKVPAA